MKAILGSFRELARYPTAIVGGLLMLALVLLAVYALIAIPYDEAIKLWRGDEDDWYKNPRNAQPVWTNWLSSKKQPESFSLHSEDDVVTKSVKESSAGFDDVTFTYSFDYAYDAFPQEMAFYFDAEFVEKQPFVSILWITPDGREIGVTDLGVKREETYRFAQDDGLARKLGRKFARYANLDKRVYANVGLFADPNSDTEKPVPLKGTYQIVLGALSFEDDSGVEAEFVLHGQIHGMAGTDHRRRDLMISLIWGAPIALAFGLVGAVGVSASTITLAALGVWFGGVVDALIQRITEVNLVLPFLSILIMVGTFYSRSLWSMLGVTILLSIFGIGIKTYRAMFLQVRESPYIEAARAYGASDMRIIFLYLIPRLIPMLIPALVLSIPTFVFLEATLAMVGLGDPVLPTWGKIIYDAVANAAVYNGYYYWMLEPAVLLTVTGFAFALVGFSLDRVFNPRLRGL